MKTTNRFNPSSAKSYYAEFIAAFNQVNSSEGRAWCECGVSYKKLELDHFSVNGKLKEIKDVIISDTNEYLADKQTFSAHVFSPKVTHAYVHKILFTDGAPMRVYEPTQASNAWRSWQQNYESIRPSLRQLINSKPKWFETTTHNKSN